MSSETNKFNFWICHNSMTISFKCDTDFTYNVSYSFFTKISLSLRKCNFRMSRSFIRCIFT